jgi:hypothetical protein
MRSRERLIDVLLSVNAEIYPAEALIFARAAHWFASPDLDGPQETPLAIGLALIAEQHASDHLRDLAEDCRALFDGRHPETDNFWAIHGKAWAIQDGRTEEIFTDTTDITVAGAIKRWFERYRNRHLNGSDLYVRGQFVEHNEGRFYIIRVRVEALS